MKKYGRPRTAETKFLYCNAHGETEYVLIGKKLPRWKCARCTVEYASAYRIRQKKKSIEYKGGACEMCGYSKYYGSLDFHHKDPLLKNFDLGGVGVQKRWDVLKKELDKCQLLCRNCHCEVHSDIAQDRINSNKKEPTMYHKKIIHRINCKKLGIRPSP